MAAPRAGPVDLAGPGRANATPSMAAAGPLVAVVWSAGRRRRRHRHLRGRQPARVALHAFHLLAAGTWLGPLTAIVLMWIPAVSDRDRADVRLTMLTGFAPIAFSGAASAVPAGLTAAWIYLGPWSNLWTTDYGRWLAVKSAFVCRAGGCGYLNWRRLHVTRQRGAHGRLALVEVVFAAVGRRGGDGRPHGTGAPLNVSWRFVKPVSRQCKAPPAWRSPDWSDGPPARLRTRSAGNESL